jgi:Tfp pilus assembly protein PilX
MTHYARATGFALPTVLVMLALTSIATLLAWRNLWVSNQLLNAEADQLRAWHSAQAVLAVALADIVGTPGSSGTALNLRHAPGDATQTHAFFPSSISEYTLLRQRLNTSATPCSAGICAPNTLSANTAQASYWKAQTASAMAVLPADSLYASNTAWYWVEVFRSAPSVSASASFVYRITVLAWGVMPGSATVLQAIWVRASDTAATGQWRSWHVLHD